MRLARRQVESPFAVTDDLSLTDCSRRSPLGFDKKMSTLALGGAFVTFDTLRRHT